MLSQILLQILRATTPIVDRQTLADSERGSVEPNDNGLSKGLDATSADQCNHSSFPGSKGSKSPPRPVHSFYYQYSVSPVNKSTPPTGTDHWFILFSFTITVNGFPIFTKAIEKAITKEYNAHKLHKLY
ncbi:unnamed protein product [[Candida] boidinii]|nr:unnamed protein product [[Candida] boidinii]